MPELPGAGRGGRRRPRENDPLRHLLGRGAGPRRPGRPAPAAVCPALHAAADEALAVGPRGAKSVGHVMHVGLGALIEGPVVLTPDGRYALYGRGVVLDLSSADPPGGK